MFSLIRISNFLILLSLIQELLLQMDVLKSIAELAVSSSIVFFFVWVQGSALQGVELLTVTLLSFDLIELFCELGVLCLKGWLFCFELLVLSDQNIDVFLDLVDFIASDSEFMILLLELV